MRRFWLLFMLLFLAACGGGGGGSSSSDSSRSAAGTEGTVVVDFNRATAKTVAAPVEFPDPAWVRVVFRNFQGTTIEGAGTENLSNKQIFDIQLGSAPSFKIPVITGSTVWTVDGIYYSKEGTLHRMQYYGKSAKFLVDDANQAKTIQVNMKGITTAIDMPTPGSTPTGTTAGKIAAGANYGVSATVDADFYDGSTTPQLLLAPAWSLAVSTSEFTAVRHLATATPAATYTLSAANYLPNSILYGQAEFFINPSLLKSSEVASNWTYIYNTAPVGVETYNEIQDSDGHSIFDDIFGPTMTSFTVSSFQTNPDRTVTGLTAKATDNIGVTGYYIYQSSVFHAGDTAPADPGKPSIAGTWQSPNTALSFTLAEDGILHGQDNYVFLYIWAKDNAGNVSDFMKRKITYNDAPHVVSFSVPSVVHTALPQTPIRIDISEFTGSSSVNGFAVTTSAIEPADSAFTGTAPAFYDLENTLANTDNSVTLYGWVKDANGTKRSVPAIINVTKRPEAVFTIADAGTQIESRTVAITGIKANTFNGNTAASYAFTETAAAPTEDSAWTPILAAEQSGTGATGQITFAATTTGGSFVYKNIFVWVKDSSGLTSLSDSRWVKTKY